MWQRALRMFTGGADVPVTSGLGCEVEPATIEALILINDTAPKFIDATERGEVQLTARPLDKVDAPRGMRARSYPLTSTA